MFAINWSAIEESSVSIPGSYEMEPRSEQLQIEGRVLSPGNATSLLPGYRTRTLLIHGPGRSISLSLSLSLSLSPSRCSSQEGSTSASSWVTRPTTRLRTRRERAAGVLNTSRLPSACLSAPTLALLLLILTQWSTTGKEGRPERERKKERGHIDARMPRTRTDNDVHWRECERNARVSPCERDRKKRKRGRRTTARR